MAPLVFADTGEAVGGVTVAERAILAGGVRVLSTRTVVLDGREWRLTRLGSDSPRRVRRRDLPAWFGAWRSPDRRAPVPRRALAARAGADRGGHTA